MTLLKKETIDKLADSLGRLAHEFERETGECIVICFGIEDKAGEMKQTLSPFSHHSAMIGGFAVSPGMRYVTVCKAMNLIHVAIQQKMRDE